MFKDATKKNDDNKLTLHVWIVCALGLFIDGYDLYISAVAEPFINNVFQPSPFMIGLTQAAAPIGALFGAILVGRMADIIGRKNLLIFNLFFFVFIALLSSLAWDITSLCFFRFLIGFGIGADYPICAAYLSEMIPKNKTDKLIAAAMFMNCLASPVGVLVAWLMFKIYPHLEVWRLMFASGAVPAIIAILFRAKLPESFTWIALQKLKPANQRASFFQEYKKLFSPNVIRITFCLSLCWFFLDISYYGIGLFIPHVLQSLHFSPHVDLLNSANEMLKSTLIINFFVMLGSLCVIFFITKKNRLKLQKIGFIYACFGLLLLGISQTSFSYINTGMIFSGLIIFNFFINFGPGTTTYLLPAEFYGTEIRATGHGFAAGFGKLGAFIGVIFLPLLQAHVGIYITIAILAITLLIGWWLTHLLEMNRVHQSDNEINEELMYSTK